MIKFDRTVQRGLFAKKMREVPGFTAVGCCGQSDHSWLRA